MCYGLFHKGMYNFPFESMTSGPDILMKFKHFIKILDIYLIKYGSIYLGYMRTTMKPKLYSTCIYDIVVCPSHR